MICFRTKFLSPFQKNPNKWQHYTLDDVDTSDRTNTSAAFSFLKELEDRNHSQEEIDCEGSSSKQKIVFKKSIKLKPRNEEIDPLLNAKKIQSTKIVMPEYVVGGQKPKPKKDAKPRDKTARSAAATNVLRLSHLDDEVDE